MLDKISLETLSRLSDAEIEKEISTRRSLQSQMLGQLYWGILEDQIQEIARLWLASRDYQARLDQEIVAKWL